MRTRTAWDWLLVAFACGRQRLLALLAALAMFSVFSFCPFVSAMDGCVTAADGAAIACVAMIAVAAEAVLLLARRGLRGSAKTPAYASPLASLAAVRLSLPPPRIDASLFLVPLRI
jgi:hypothetical protein